MKRFKKRTLALVLASVVTVVGAFGANNYKNCLMGLKFENTANGGVNMFVQTKSLYNGEVNLLRKDVNTYVLTLPEVYSEADAPNLDVVSTNIASVNIRTMPYPGFPTDMQAIISAVMCVSSGTSIVVENIFENRYKYMQELQRMGAKIKIEGKTAIIKGTRKLYGSTVKSTDLRGGASMVLAGLVAKGKTEVDEIKYILRGYEGLDKKLNSLGASIMLK